MAKLILILGDQLSENLSSLKEFDPHQDKIVMAEVMDEAQYVKHHKKKIAFLFAAMRHFAEHLRNKGFSVDYYAIDRDTPLKSLEEAVQNSLKGQSFGQLIITEPGEYRLLQIMQNWRDDWDITVEIRNDDRFLCSHDDFEQWAGDKPKSLRMEFFYRMMRKRLNLLMDDDKPVGGKWNYDHDNRARLPKDITIPKRPTFTQDATTQQALKDVESHFSHHFGTLGHFDYPVTKAEANDYLDWFIKHALPDFGTYQDAMQEGDALLFHSHLSGLINCGLLDPLTCCHAAETAYREDQAPLNAVEGFIRQIIGWREFLRGIYWLKMPDYACANALKATRPLPQYFWTGKTKMNCLKQAIQDTHDLAYAHHIQRLMVIGNFCLIAGIEPKQVQEWFLAVYHDAYEWVELPNVSGMALFADGGFLASKPYAASGSYIHKMSNYCGNCAYRVQDKTGKDACPFNLLYWDFMDRHEETLSSNHRMGMIYRNWAKAPDDRKTLIRKEAAQLLDDIERL